jgi:hypothetical protein
VVDVHFFSDAREVEEFPLRFGCFAVDFLISYAFHMISLRRRR